MVQLIRTGDGGASGAGDARAARLRQLIGRKRSEKLRLEQEMEEGRVVLAQVQARRRERLDPLDDEVHEHFRAALTSGAFSEADRLDVFQLYIELMTSEALSWRDPPGVGPAARVDESRCRCPHCEGAIEEEVAGAPPGGDAERVPVRPKGGGGDEAPSLRDLYRDLASRYHPDKATDEETRLENERLMREINGAYAAGDLDALAALSQELGFEIAGDGVLETLARQYEALKREVRGLRKTSLGQFVVWARGCKKHGEPPPLESLSAMVDESAAHLIELVEVFRGYRDGLRSQEQFLAELLGDDELAADDLFGDDVLVETMVAIASRMEGAGGGRARSSRPGAEGRRGKGRTRREEASRRR